MNFKSRMVEALLTPLLHNDRLAGGVHHVSSPIGTQTVERLRVAGRCLMLSAAQLQADK